MSTPASWFLAVEVLIVTLLAAVPVCRWSRRYLDKPLRQDDASGQDGVEPPGGSRRPRVRHLWVLTPLPQAALALITGVLAAWWGTYLGAAAAAAVAVPVIAVLGCAASVDAVAHLLPNRLLGAGAAWLALCGVVSVVTAPHLAPAARSGLRALVCALGAGVLGVILASIGSGLGLGDVKLSAVIGLWLGWYSIDAVVLALLIGIMLGGLGAIMMLAMRRVGRKDTMAYGPYLVAGTFLAWPLAIM